MNPNTHKKEVNKDSYIDSILSHNTKSLENRIQHLESSIQLRHRLCTDRLLAVGTQILRLNTRLRQNHYNTILNDTSSPLAQRAQLEEQKTKILTDCFRDVADLYTQLQEVTEALELEKHKASLLGEPQ